MNIAEGSEHSSVCKIHTHVPRLKASMLSHRNTPAVRLASFEQPREYGSIPATTGARSVLLVVEGNDHKKNGGNEENTPRSSADSSALQFFPKSRHIHARDHTQMPHLLPS